jgi:multiple sugar transport system ATP-binding protein
MAEVVLEHLSKVYPSGVEAVRDFSLHVADGELVVLVGPSGCGKTTTLRLIAGLEEPTNGHISIGGQDVTRRPPRERDVALVFQRSTLYPHLSVRRNLQFSYELRETLNRRGRYFQRWLGLGAADKILAERVSGAARLLGLEDVLDRLPSQLSGGQQQRVALGRAIVRRPAVFLLDEPLSHLDGRLRSELRHELHLLQRQLRATMVYVTHDQAEALTLADRVIVMDRGVVQQVDTPLGVYDLPANRFVAGFVGWPSMNFLEGQVQVTTGRMMFAVAGWPVPLTAKNVPAGLCHPEQPAVLGLRAEDISLATSGPETNRLRMEVALTESLGHASLVTLRRDGWQVTARLPRGPLPGRQESVDVEFHMEHAHWFDLETGIALPPAG